MKVNYSLTTMISEYKKNRHLIEAKFMGKTVENYQTSQILGMDSVIFLLLW